MNFIQEIFSRGFAFRALIVQTWLLCWHVVEAAAVRGSKTSVPETDVSLVAVLKCGAADAVLLLLRCFVAVALVWTFAHAQTFCRTFHLKTCLHAISRCKQVSQH